MDDLSGLNWTSPPSGQNNRPPPVAASTSQYGHLRPTPPVSGRSTPLSGQPGRSNPPSKPNTPSNDSFSNLVSFSSSSETKNLSLLERQKRLQEEKARQDAQKREQLDAQFGGSNAQFWDTLGQSSTKSAGGTSAGGNGYLEARNQMSGGSGSAPSLSRGLSTGSHAASEEEEDILAAFNSSAPVDASTNFPVPSATNSRKPSPGFPEGGSAETQDAFPDDDDPFGLGGMSSTTTSKSAQRQTQPAQDDDDDDILGLLAKPVSEFSRSEPEKPQPDQQTSPRTSSSSPENPLDRSVAELVDMGFPADKSRQALANTESGTDIQAAVGWLLNQAHAESRQKGKPNRATPDISEGGPRRPDSTDRDVPPWMNNEGRSRSNDSRSSATAERDAAKIAAGIGNNLFKTANTLWKTGSKKVQQAVNEFQTEPDPSQPRWMREAGLDSTSQASEGAVTEQPSRQRTPVVQSSQDITNEALLLETGQSRPTKPRRQRDELSPVSQEDRFRRESPDITSEYGERRTQQPAFLRQQQQPPQPPPSRNPRARLNREAIDEQSSQAYISPARRKKQSTPKPQTSESEPDLLGNSSAARPASRPATESSKPQHSRPAKPSSPIPVRPKAPPRNIPRVSPASIQSSHQHREKGSEAFRRGDYSAAHECYSTALTHLPDKHPITIVLLSNRALTGIKIGEPKTAVADADAIIAVIGPSKGEAEKIDLENGQASKDMREFFGKALMRKAEALEQMERWADAAAVWREAVESSHGGSASIQGRNRCEKAAGISTTKPTSRPPAAPKKKVSSAPKASALDDLSGKPAVVSEGKAVSALRAANDAAERADDEKFALSDSVEARLTAWKGGKQDNLRALLGSLDTVLWPEAGWKKISMAELVLPNKVKIQYMKGIAKVHPDKVRCHY